MTERLTPANHYSGLSSKSRNARSEELRVAVDKEFRYAKSISSRSNTRQSKSDPPSTPSTAADLPACTS